MKQILLQSEEELLAKQSSELTSEGAAPKPKKTIGKLKVQGKVTFEYVVFVCVRARMCFFFFLKYVLHVVSFLSFSKGTH